MLFASMKEKLPNWKPSLIKLDFEQAVIGALENNFPEAKISGCNFHFKQCIWKNVGLVSEYTDNEKIRLHIRM
ncbi:unnamed protein product [Diabrotica balteata]|uniref:MULE transposase domain-containing protein n=1 Tax=Diabrotica balteata TaxID=107213 RepID=A0A9N9T6Y0_DIABA|nr:unnamed protein product [Diabrotica balteata]